MFLFIKDISIPQHLLFAQYLSEKMNKELVVKESSDFTHTKNDSDFADTLQGLSADLIFISCRCQKRVVQKWLNLSRQLRIPYIFLTDIMAIPQEIATILTPVSMFEEEVHKAQFAAHISRYTNATILLLTAHDYGSKAQNNTNKITTLFDKMNVKYEKIQAHKDSFKLQKEIIDHKFTSENPYQISLITASRDYGLDDIFFGPQERHTICNSLVPTMLINPRGDLYSLCD